MSKATLSKILGWVGAFALYAQNAIASQAVLPHDGKGWATLVASIVLGAAVHHASSTDGTR